MGSFSIWHWLIIAVIVAILFGGGGKLSSMMGDAAKGVRAFRDGLKGEDKEDEKDKDKLVNPLPSQSEREKDKIVN